MSWRSSAAVGGRPGGRCGWVQCPPMRRRCQRNSVSGVTSHPARLGRASAAAIAASKLRSVSVNSGRSTWPRSTASWWRNTMISRSFERPDRTASRASDARNRYKIRYTRNQDRPSSLQVNAHGRVFGTHTARSLPPKSPHSNAHLQTPTIKPKARKSAAFDEVRVVARALGEESLVVLRLLKSGGHLHTVVPRRRGHSVTRGSVPRVRSGILVGALVAA